MKKKVKVDFDDCCDAVYCANTVPRSVSVALRVVVVAVATSVIFAAGMYSGKKIATQALQQEAIKCGVGEYYMFDQLSGETKFQFVNDAQ